MEGVRRLGVPEAGGTQLAAGSVDIDFDHRLAGHVLPTRSALGVGWDVEHQASEREVVPGLVEVEVAAPRPHRP